MKHTHIYIHTQREREQERERVCVRETQTHTWMVVDVSQGPTPPSKYLLHVLVDYVQYHPECLIPQPPCQAVYVHTGVILTYMYTSV